MLKINLLPKSIYERRNVYRLASVFGVIFVGVVFGLFAWWFMLGNKEIVLSGDVDEMELKTSILKEMEKQVEDEKAKLPPMADKVKFIEDLMAYNLKVPKLYEEVAKYTYSRILYKSITPSGAALSIQAHADSLADCGRYLLNMYNATKIFSSVTISAVPAWSDANPADAPSGFDFTVTCTLVEPITAPAPPGTAPPPAPGGPAAGPSGEPSGEAPAPGPAPGRAGRGAGGGGGDE